MGLREDVNLLSTGNFQLAPAVAARDRILAFIEKHEPKPKRSVVEIFDDDLRIRCPSCLGSERRCNTCIDLTITIRNFLSAHQSCVPKMTRNQIEAILKPPYDNCALGWEWVVETLGFMKGEME